MKITAEINKFEQMLDNLSGKFEKAAGPASKAGADVLYAAVKSNLDRVGVKTGNLRQGIYRAFVREESGWGRAVYRVSWNYKKAPHGHLVEFGHIQKFVAYIGKNGQWYTDKSKPLAQPRQVAARPFMRPAVALFPEAVRVMEAKLVELTK